MPKPFCHLHLHTQASLLDGATKIDELAAFIQECGMPAVAMTDHGNLHSMPQLLSECKNRGVKPIVGMEAYVAPGSRWERALGGRNGDEHSFHLTLLALNGEGVRNLYRLSTKAFLEGYYYKPRVDHEILELHSEGLVCLSGCVGSEYSDLILAGKLKEAEELCRWYQKVFGEDNFFIEIQNNDIDIQREHEEIAVDFADRLGLPLVGSSDAHYLKSSDAPIHDVLLCINTGSKRHEEKRMKFGSDKFHVRTPDEMYAAMPGRDEALKRTVEIAERVEPNYTSLEFGKRQFPSFPVPSATTPEDELRRICEAGLVERYGENPDKVYRDRLAHELEIICRMGFASYFLIVWDFIRFARDNGIPTNARGSACGAIVSYLLGISHVCPIENGLLFERFLDPNRAEAPDIDIDICKQRRSEVIQYVRQKYGESNVAQICNFGTMAAKASIKDVGRALDVPLGDVIKLSNLIPQTPNITLEDARKTEPLIEQTLSQIPELQEVWDIAVRLEGTMRNVGTHAAGVVIADKPLIDIVPLQKVKNKQTGEEVVSTQWEMGDVEKAGLLKMDFLGLRNMTSLAEACRLVEERHGVKLDPHKFPKDDVKTYKLLQRGESQGLFQVEGSGISELLVKMKPDRFADLPAILALYRPGPLKSGMVDLYVDCKHGRKDPEYLNDIVMSCLETTYGVYCFQEQVMSILHRLGGVELTKAYAVIKAISKKDLEKMMKAEKDFIAGCLVNGVSEVDARRIWETICGFAGYGFNLCTSGDTKLRRIGANANASREQLTVEEMYLIRNDAEYAKATGHKDLRGKWMYQKHYGYGLSLCDDGRIRKNKIVDIQPAGVREVLKITDVNGNSIRVTGNHKFPTPEGEKRADELRVGDSLFLCGEYEKNRKSYNWSEYSKEDRLEKVGDSGFDTHGEENRWWTNGSWTLQQIFDREAPNVCGDCGEDREGKRIEIHHINGDRTNSNHDNLVKLCPGCHKKREYAVGRRRRDEKGYPAILTTIASIEPDGSCMTYDVTMDKPNHTFVVSSNIVTCNSHATAYADLLFQTAYMKAHYPLEFMTAVLSSEMDGADQKHLMGHLEDCRRMGFKILPPDVNNSEAVFTIEGRDTIRFGLGAVKGISLDKCAAVVKARQTKPFTDWVDFFERVPHAEAGQSVAQTLLYAGAFDSFGYKRSQLLAVANDASKHGKRKQADVQSGQMSLLDLLDEPEEQMVVPDIPELSDDELSAQEKKAIGFYLTRHPLLHIRSQLGMCRTHQVRDLDPLSIEPNQTIMLAGLLSSVTPRTLKNPRTQYTRWAKIIFEDLSGSIQANCWSEEYHRLYEILREDAIVVLTGRLDSRRETPEFIIDDAQPLAQVVARNADRVKLILEYGELDDLRVSSLCESLRKMPQGGLKTLIEIRGEPGASRSLYHATNVSLDWSPDLTQRLEAVVGKGCVEVDGTPARIKKWVEKKRWEDRKPAKK